MTFAALVAPENVSTAVTQTAPAGTAPAKRPVCPAHFIGTALPPTQAFTSKRFSSHSVPGAIGQPHSIDISEPREIRVVIMGPMKPAGVAVSKAETRWLIPGQPVVGDGWVVE
ncbi:MAG: hypothetical protein B7Z50_05795, partial [Sphingomonadales bacterium 12-62-5]